MPKPGFETITDIPSATETHFRKLECHDKHETCDCHDCDFNCQECDNCYCDEGG